MLTLSVEDVVRIGVVLGVDLAERVYGSLREEPLTPRGDRIDWEQIAASIQRRIGPRADVSGVPMTGP